MRGLKAGPQIFIIKVLICFFRKVFANTFYNFVILIRTSKKRRCKHIETVLICERSSFLKPHAPAGRAPCRRNLTFSNIIKESTNIIITGYKLQPFGFKISLGFSFSFKIFGRGVNVGVIEKPCYAEIFLFRLPDRIYGAGGATGM